MKEYTEKVGELMDWMNANPNATATDINNQAIRLVEGVNQEKDHAASILNIPLDRVQRKLENIQGAMDRDLDNWQRAFMLLGWSDWELEDSKNKKAQRTILKTK